MLSQECDSSIVELDDVCFKRTDFEDVVQRYWFSIFQFVLASVRDRGFAEDLTP